MDVEAITRANGLEQRANRLRIGRGCSQRPNRRDNGNLAPQIARRLDEKNSSRNRQNRQETGDEPTGDVPGDPHGCERGRQDRDECQVGHIGSRVRGRDVHYHACEQIRDGVLRRPAPLRAAEQHAEAPCHQCH